MSEIEERISLLISENILLIEKKTIKQNEIKDLDKEISYRENVIAHLYENIKTQKRKRK
jgi:hypothetical protein